MEDEMLKSAAEPPSGLAVLVVTYKREEELRLCIGRLHEIGVERVYIAGDGARTDGDRAQVAAVRDFVAGLPSGFIAGTRLSEINHGCRSWVSSSISWFFEHEEFGIIVEEDILIDRRFLVWCRAVAKDYADSTNVMHVNAFYPASVKCSVRPAHLTKFATSWGWATWRRAWLHYDDNMSGFLSRSALSRLLQLHRALDAGWAASVHYFLALQMTNQGKLSSWAYRWNLSIWESGGFALSPGINLSTNIGIGENATHTGNEASLLAFTLADPSEEIEDGIMLRSSRLDAEIFSAVGRTRSLARTLRMLVAVFVPNSVFFVLRRAFRS